MDENKTSVLSPAMVMRKVTVCYSAFNEHLKRTVRKARRETAKAARDTSRVFRIMILLPYAKDSSSVLRLYGIENSPKTEVKRADKTSLYE
jgi:hypothetical protein